MWRITVMLLTVYVTVQAVADNEQESINKRGAVEEESAFVKRGGDARFATGAMGAAFNRIQNHLYSKQQSKSAFDRAQKFGRREMEDPAEELSKRGGDAMFATGTVGRAFNRLGNYYGAKKAGKGTLAGQQRFGKREDADSLRERE